MCVQRGKRHALEPSDFQLDIFLFVSLSANVQEILQLSIPEEYRDTVGGTEAALYAFTGVLRDDATQEVVRG